jgi:SAM-dependent methyltransferase
MYQTFAYYYDLLMDKSLYNAWANFVGRHFGDLSNQRVLDLACGTGDLAVRFAQAGAQTFGVDLSEEMLTIAEERRLIANQKIDLLQGNMLNLDELGVTQLDLATCFDDSICYLADEAEVGRCFEQVHQTLKPNGTFLFDVHSLYQMTTVFPGYMYNEQDQDWAFMWSSFEGELPASVHHDLTFFVWREDLGAYEALQETHVERTYAIETYCQLLTGAGFTDIEVYGGFEDEQLTTKTPRWFFKAKRR